MAICRREHLSPTRTSNVGVVGKHSDLDQYLAPSHAVNAATARCYQHGAAGPWQVVTLIADSKRQSLLMAGDDDNEKKSQRYAKENRTAFNCTQ